VPRRGRPRSQASQELTLGEGGLGVGQAEGGSRGALRGGGRRLVIGDRVVGLARVVVRVGAGRLALRVRVIVVVSVGVVVLVPAITVVPVVSVRHAVVVPVTCMGIGGQVGR
jgi:hypothetical protein